MKKETIEKFKNLPLTNKGMSTAISHAIAVFIIVPILLICVFLDIDIPSKYFPLIVIAVIGLDLFILKKWMQIANLSKEVQSNNK